MSAHIAWHHITLLGNLWSPSLPVISGKHQIASLPGEEYGADARGHTTAGANRGSFWSSRWLSALKKGIMAIWSLGGAWGPPTVKSLGRCSQWTGPLPCRVLASPWICRPFWQAGPSSLVLKENIVASFVSIGLLLPTLNSNHFHRHVTALVVVLLWWFGCIYLEFRYDIVPCT